MATKVYNKHFLPLESNPAVFTDLIHELGVSRTLHFEDIFSLDEPEWLPRPALALILVFPTTEADDERRAAEGVDPYDAVDRSKDEVVWFKQTIHNACGLYAIMHAISNGAAREYIEHGSLWASLLDSCASLNTQDKALLLEGSVELEEKHRTAALQGDTDAPEDAAAEVEHHYICFVPSMPSGHVYELDGDRKGPIETGVVLDASEDMLSEKALTLIKAYIDKADGENVGFNLMALVRS